MKKYLFILIGFGLVFFAVGLVWGVWNHKKQAEHLAMTTPLRILCGEKWLSNSVLEKFSKDHSVKIQQWTYTRPSEFLRQMANADGKVDVICTSSLLLKSLVHSHWLKKMDFQSLSNMRLVAVDFSHLPYDPMAEYSVPLFWTLYGFFGKGESPKAETWKQAWQSKRLSLWGEELNVLQIMTRMGMNIEELLQEEENSRSRKSLDDEVKHFTKNAVHFLKPDPAPMSAESMMAKAEWIQLPLARVANLLGESSPYTFWLPEDGATLEVGVLAVGEKSTQPDLAMELINELISSEEAMETHKRLGAGVVHSSLSGLNSISPWQKPEALRRFPLNRLLFPSLNIEALPRFQKIFDDTVAAEY